MGSCQMPADLKGEELLAYVGMPASAFNDQALARAKHAQLRKDAASWIGVDGGFTLATRINGRKMQFPVSGTNGGGLQIATWRGADGNLAESVINALEFAVDPQEVGFSDAWRIAQDYCRQAASAGLPRNDEVSIEAGPGSGATAARASASPSGVAVCSLANKAQVFEIRVTPFSAGDAEAGYRVLVSIGAYVPGPI